MPLAAWRMQFSYHNMKQIISTNTMPLFATPRRRHAAYATVTMSSQHLRHRYRYDVISMLFHVISRYYVAVIDYAVSMADAVIARAMVMLRVRRAQLRCALRDTADALSARCEVLILLSVVCCGC